MATASGGHSVVRETLLLVRQQLRAQADTVQALSTQLEEAQRKLDLLETLNTSLDQFQPGQTETASAVRAVTVEMPGQATPPEPTAPAAVSVDSTGYRASKPFSIQEMVLDVLSTAQDPLRTRDLVTIIERLRDEGKTDLLRDSRRPDSIVSSALDRLCKKGLVRKAGRGRYTLS
ncbi:hypothetical protein [Streptomyces sp. NPDC091416]|uniref:hypothetical protein n=1 Tax=Streptomyces sp. NPDC091416 TaxID=3366003 RepID=UPI00380C4E20